MRETFSNIGVKNPSPYVCDCDILRVDKHGDIESILCFLSQRKEREFAI